jgi:hypothetical protein
MEQQVWVCGSCRSINQPRTTRCYSCRTPRSVGEADPASMPVGGQVPAAPTAAAVGPFRSTARLALLAQVLVLVAIAVVAAAGLITFLVRMDPEAVGPTFIVGIDMTLLLAVIQGLFVIAALVGFASWLSRVVANVPALGGGYTNVTPQMAFIENFIPVANLFRIPAILRDVMQRLEAGGKGDALLIASWLAFVSAIFLPRLNIFVAFVSEDLAAVIEGAAILGLISVVLQALGGVFLVLLMGHVESVQAARAASTVAAAATA